MNNGLKPIFLFSLPRSGSTLVQRVLGAHQEIATVSEPHILLPYIYSTKKKGIYTEYGHEKTAEAIDTFCQEFPHGQDDYREEMATFIIQLYAKAAKGNARYFLDKTPRYTLVIDEILRLFQNGKFIVLVRNPLAVISSIMETFKGGRWCVYAFNADLFTGLSNLISVCKKYADRIHLVRYEDLILNSDLDWQRLFRYLDLSFDKEFLVKFSTVELKGNGDPTGRKKYQSISKEPLEKWKRTLSNPLRKAWCRHYLQWIGRERLEVIGYNMAELLADLDSIPNTFHMLGSDLLRMPYGIAYRLMEPKLMLQKLHLFPDWYKINPHY